MGPINLLIATCFLQTVLGYYTLKQLSYTQLATSNSRGTYVYGGLNLGTATDAAYDPVNNIVYIIGNTFVSFSYVYFPVSFSFMKVNFTDL